MNMNGRNCNQTELEVKETQEVVSLDTSRTGHACEHVPTQMRAYEESWRWERGRNLCTGPSSRAWQGQWETSGQWDGVGGNWDQFGSDNEKPSNEHDNIMQWDDSGAQEALRIAKERYEAGSRGLVYPVSLPSPDLYIQLVDWDTHEVFDLPSADALVAREETKGQRKRGRKDGRCEREGRGIQQDKFKCGSWRQMKMERVSPSSGRHDLQVQLGQSEWDHRMPDINSFPNAPPQDRQAISGWGEVQLPWLQSSWQDHTMGHCDWPKNPQNQPICDGLQWSTGQNSVQGGWSYRNGLHQTSLGMQNSQNQPSCDGLQWSTGQDSVQGGWIYRNGLHQTARSTQNGCSGDYQRNPNDAGHWSAGMRDACPGERSVHSPHHSRVGPWQQDRRGPGLQPYVGLSNRWRQPKQQWHNKK